MVTEINFLIKNMPRKQPVVAKRKKIGLHILSAAVITIIFVGGNMFLLLAPLFPVYSKGQASLVERLAGSASVKSTEKNVVYVNPNTEIVHDKKVYNVSKELNGGFSLYREDVGGGNSKKPLLSIPDESEILGSVTSQDKNLVVFSVLHNPEFKFLAQNSPEGHVPHFVVPFVYNKNTNQIEDISTGQIPGFDDFSFSFRFPLPKSISKNNRYVAFESYQCWNCGGHIPETRIYDVERRVFKNLGRVLDFEWLEGSSYQYKEFISQECQGEDVGSGICYTDPEKLPYKKGVLK